MISVAIGAKAFLFDYARSQNLHVDIIKVRAGFTWEILRVGEKRLCSHYLTGLRYFNSVTFPLLGRNARTIEWIKRLSMKFNAHGVDSVCTFGCLYVNISSYLQQG